MKKNVLFLVQETYLTGVSNAVAKISKHLSDTEFKKKIVAYDASRIDYTYGGKIIDLNTTSKSGPLGKFSNLIKRVVALKKIKRKKEIDVTISFQLSASLINILTRKNDRVIISIRNAVSNRLSGLVGAIYLRVIKLYFDRADAIVTVSEQIKWDLVTNFNLSKQKVKVIYNFYEIQKIKELASEPIEKDFYQIFKHPVVYTVGRLEEQKGHWHLIRAFKEVKRTITDAKLLIIGEGKLMSYLIDLANKLEIKEDVHIIGYRNNPYKYMMHGDVFVLPSLYEGFPNVLCEAMACKVPVIAADCKSGPREILSTSLNIQSPSVDSISLEKYGVLIPVCDGMKHTADIPLQKEELILSDSITLLLENKQYREHYKKKSFERVNDFTKEVIMEKWKDTINP